MPTSSEHSDAKLRCLHFAEAEARSRTRRLGLVSLEGQDDVNLCHATFLANNQSLSVLVYSKFQLE